MKQSLLERSFSFRPKKKILFPALVLTFCGFGFLIRSHGLGHLGFWYDEMALWYYSLTGIPATPLDAPMMPWLLFSVMWWVKSVDPLIIHFIPVLIGSFTIPFSYWTAKKIEGDRVTGLIIAFLVSISPMAIYYSREGRPYALFILASACLYACFIRANRRNETSAWLLYALLLTFCFLVHLLTLQIVIALGIFSVFLLFFPIDPKDLPRQRLKRFFNFTLFSLIGGLAGGGWAILRYMESLVSKIGLEVAYRGTYEFGVFNFIRTAFINLGPGPVRHINGSFFFSDFLALLFILFFIQGIRSLFKRHDKELACLGILIIFIPFLINYLVLGSMASWDWARYISHTMLPFLFIVGIGLRDILKKVKKGYLQVIILALVSGVLFQSLEIPHRKEYTKYKQAIQYLKENTDSLEGVIILPYHLDTRIPADRRIANIYYQHKVETLPVLTLNAGTLGEAVVRPSKGNLTQIINEEDGRKIDLKSGKYAVISRRGFEDCRKVSHIIGNYQVEAQHSDPVLEGLTICGFTFEE